MAQLSKRPELALHLLYFRPESAACASLDAKLVDLAARYRQRLRLVIKHTSENGQLFGGWVSGTSPTVLFVRGDRAVAQFVGDLPSSEIDRLIQAALSFRR